MTKAYQVVGIGNALVDVISHVEDGFLVRQGDERAVVVGLAHEGSPATPQAA